MERRIAKSEPSEESAHLNKLGSTKQLLRRKEVEEGGTDKGVLKARPYCYISVTIRVPKAEDDIEVVSDWSKAGKRIQKPNQHPVSRDIEEKEAV